MAWVAIRGNWLRSFLTALGIIIGVATVIAVVSLGAGSRKAVESAVESLGTNLVIAYANPFLGATFTPATAQPSATLGTKAIAIMSPTATTLSCVMARTNRGSATSVKWSPSLLNA
jgi:putative ABC transport system permease protein